MRAKLLSLCVVLGAAVGLNGLACSEENRAFEKPSGAEDTTNFKSLVACSADDDCLAPQTVIVELANDVFIPADITIKVGETVHWDWIAGFHNVESGIFPDHDGNFLSILTADTDTTFEVVFDQVFLAAHPMPDNFYPYYCVVHAGLGMTGTVTVLAGNCIDSTCDTLTGQCVNFANDALCDDALFCTGVETCDPVSGCQTGSNPCIDPNFPVCNEANDTCEAGSACLVDADCDDGLFCNGQETCDPQGGCQPGAPPCAADCCEDTDTCGPCNGDPCASVNCDDGNPCTNDSCNNGICSHTDNTSACDDGDPCTENDVCSDGECSGTLIDCDDGIYCNGQEECVDGSCQSGAPPCLAECCDEATDTCEQPCEDECQNDNDCPVDGNLCKIRCENGVCVEGQIDNGDFCDGTETCDPDTGDVISSGDPCEGTPRPICDEEDDGCVECRGDTDCDDGEPCTDDSCENGECVSTNNAAECDDDDSCTNDDVCSNGACAGTEITCPGGQTCVDGDCVPSWNLLVEIEDASGDTTQEPPTLHAAGEVVEIEVPAAPEGESFDHWEGDVPTGQETSDPLVLVMDSDKSITAVFQAIPCGDDADCGPNEVCVEGECLPEGCCGQSSPLMGAIMFFGLFFMRHHMSLRRRRLWQHILGHGFQLFGGNCRRDHRSLQEISRVEVT